MYRSKVPPPFFFSPRDEIKPTKTFTNVYGK